ncbi:putative peroxisomal-coenzyme A synthetase [Metarhizium anisopliae]|nr:putative peroxisomal-coenzyme A synthetase [Metarhizium anisopliae]
MAGIEQFRADVLQSGAKVILTSSQDYEKLQLGDEWASDENIEIFVVDWNNRDDIRILNTAGHVLKPHDTRPRPNAPDDIALILFTSGTSGTKKVVPMKLHSIVAGVVFVMDSWALSPVDTCLNMMPLYHV